MPARSSVSSHRRRLRTTTSRTAGALALALLLAACGSTIPASPNGAAAGRDGGGGDSDLLGSDVENGDDGAPGGGDDSGSAANGGDRPGSPSGPRTQRSTTTTPGGGGDDGSVRYGRGVTDTTIKVAIEYALAADAVLAAFGASAVASGDWQQQYQAVVDDLNKRGGILGRKLDVVWIGYDFNGDYATQEQAACAKAVDDQKVFAVIAFPHSETGISCYEKGGVVQIVGGGFSSFDERIYRTYKHLVGAGNASLDRLIPVWVDALVANGFFGTTQKIGLVTHEAPKWQRASKAVDARLKRHGLKLDQVARTPEFNTTSDGTGFNRAMANAVVKFKDAGVTHVLFFQSTGFGINAFHNAAEPQEYRPMYGITTNDGPWAQTTSATKQPNQLRNMRGVGFAPLKDVEQAYAPPTPGAARCRAVMAAAGLTPFKNQNTESSSQLRCDPVWLLEEAIKAGGPSITRESFFRGLEKVGGSMPFSSTFRSAYQNGRRDGVGEVRYLTFDTGCSCMKYTSGPIPVE